MQVRIALTAATAAAALALPAAAPAHVTVNPRTVEAGSFQVLGVRVPNERDDSATVRVELRLPPGFAFVSYEPQPGWRVRLVERGGEVAKVVFRGSRRGLGRIAPHQFREFRLSTLVPGRAGDVLTFKALQTYADGQVVRWTGAPASERPAPRVTLNAGGGAHGAARAAHAPVVRRSPAPGSTASGVTRVGVRFAQGMLSGSITVRRAGRVVAARTRGLKPGDRTLLRATFARALAAGGYGVSWSATAGDGHRQTGSWSFAVR